MTTGYGVCGTLRDLFPFLRARGEFVYRHICIEGGVIPEKVPQVPQTGTHFLPNSFLAMSWRCGTFAVFGAQGPAEVPQGPAEFDPRSGRP